MTRKERTALLLNGQRRNLTAEDVKERYDAEMLREAGYRYLPMRAMWTVWSVQSQGDER